MQGRAVIFFVSLSSLSSCLSDRYTLYSRFVWFPGASADPHRCSKDPPYSRACVAGRHISVCRQNTLAVLQSMRAKLKFSRFFKSFGYFFSLI